jgi:PAS domain-containing protein
LGTIIPNITEENTVEWHGNFLEKEKGEEELERIQRTMEDLKNDLFATIYCDLEGNILHTNEELSSLLGYSQAEMRTFKWRDLGPPEMG